MNWNFVTTFVWLRKVLTLNRVLKIYLKNPNFTRISQIAKETQKMAAIKNKREKKPFTTVA